MKNPNDYAKQKERALSRKIELIKIKGSSCEKCGYDKNISALEFHHLNREDKDFNLDSRHLSNTTIEKLLIEVNKCSLLCSNCHKETHYPYFNKANIDNLLMERQSENKSIFHENKKTTCKFCGNDFKPVKGKLYCSVECRENDKSYPTINELNEIYSTLKSWDKVAEYFKITRKITQRIRKINK